MSLHQTWFAWYGASVMDPFAPSMVTGEISLPRGGRQQGFWHRHDVEIMSWCSWYQGLFLHRLKLPFWGPRTLWGWRVASWQWLVHMLCVASCEYATHDGRKRKVRLNLIENWGLLFWSPQNQYTGDVCKGLLQLSEGEVNTSDVNQTARYWEIEHQFWAEMVKWERASSLSLASLNVQWALPWDYALDLIVEVLD